MDSLIINMPSIDDQLAEFKELFSFFDDPMDKFAQIIDVGKSSKGLDEIDRNENTKITGCTSQAWVKCTQNNDNTFLVRTDSDAFIVRGLLNILEKLLDGRTAEEVLSVEAKDILGNIGLNRSITSQRTNGFISAINKIHQEIQELENAK
ncbi:MAG: SufE family protein [Candidatus Marinimicrobia bacterium]|jgi:cysteine desulfuration protein SufE|nr:SufE family protein [Candidatus Neomarinimicrobiota bacterium]|tara:strand:+ start:9656 stop:10105 length:450 start_codon:yes stop_codon:yes gene_type:complete